MVKHFDPSCPKCNKKFHVHHEDLRYAGVKLLCPYCQHEFFVDECETLVEHDGTVTHPKQKAQAQFRVFFDYWKNANVDLPPLVAAHKEAAALQP